MPTGQAVDASRPSFTARGIALAIHCLRHSRFVRNLPAAAAWRSGRHVEAEFVARIPGIERRLLPFLATAPARRAFLTALDLRIRGTSRHLLARKIWFDQTARAFLARHETASVMILGAGLDGLGVRVQEAYPSAEITEFDRMGTMRAKEQADCSVRFVPCDLVKFDPSILPVSERPTLVIAEGLFMYLPEARVRALIARLAASRRGLLTLAFSHLDRTVLDDRRSPIARLGRRLARSTEPFAWSTQAELPDVLGPLQLESDLDACELARRILGQSPTVDYGERIATATRPRMSHS